MAALVNVHRNLKWDSPEREPWKIDFDDHKSFQVVRIQNGSDTITFFDDDMKQFVNALLAAWDDFNG